MTEPRVYTILVCRKCGSFDPCDCANGRWRTAEILEVVPKADYDALCHKLQAEAERKRIVNDFWQRLADD